MPEALAVLAVMVVALVAWLGAWLQARNPANHRPEEDVARLRHHAAWLEQRLEMARREKWGVAMETSLAAELDATTGALASAGGATSRPVPLKA